jgi:predicted  nucleic acid-binding Zn-ribbon protein
MNIDKELQNLADDAIISLAKKIVRLTDERDSAIAKARDTMIAFVENVDSYCAQISYLKNEISNLHTRINTLEHLLELARKKND